jgi:probable phosphoglycerate mutase
VEWDYGDYEGLQTAQIRETRPDWQLFRDGCPNGESPAQVGERADRILNRLREIEGNVLIFSSGHFLRVLTARWLGLEPIAGRLFMLKTASLSALGFENTLSQPVIQFWDDTTHTEQ